ncbi:MAG: hypothetical protein L7F78_26525, partial [Syntrophales bacterium LBB04]|nr:hypothetical protein [Syntrophales bacterium LBB04]
MLLNRALPAICLIVNRGIDQRNDVIDDARRDVRRLVLNITHEEQAIISGVRQLAVALSLLPDLQSSNVRAVSALFSNILKKNPLYT